MDKLDDVFCDVDDFCKVINISGTISTNVNSIYVGLLKLIAANGSPYQNN